MRSYATKFVMFSLFLFYAIGITYGQEKEALRTIGLCELLANASDHENQRIRVEAKYVVGMEAAFLKPATDKCSSDDHGLDVVFAKSWKKSTDKHILTRFDDSLAIKGEKIFALRGVNLVIEGTLRTKADPERYLIPFEFHIARIVDVAKSPDD